VGKERFWDTFVADHMTATSTPALRRQKPKERDADATHQALLEKKSFGPYRNSQGTPRFVSGDLKKSKSTLALPGERGPKEMAPQDTREKGGNGRQLEARIKKKIREKRRLRERSKKVDPEFG